MLTCSPAVVTEVTRIFGKEKAELIFKVVGEVANDSPTKADFVDMKNEFQNLRRDFEVFAEAIKGVIRESENRMLKTIIASIVGSMVGLTTVFSLVVVMFK